MDQKTYKDRVKRLQEVDSVIKTLDPSIRDASFKLLQSFVTGGKLNVDIEDDDVHDEIDNDKDNSGDDFFAKFDHDKPADNVFLIAAHFFAEYGSAPFSLAEVRKKAKDVGLTIPNSPAMTLRAAIREGKKLFIKTGRAAFKPTTNGEKFLKTKYSVKKGTKAKPEGSEQ